MFDVGWQLWCVFLLAGIIVYALLEGPEPWGRLAERLAVRPGAMTADAKRKERTERLKADYPNLTNDTVSSLLLSEAKELAKSKFDGIRGLEGKATAQIGLIGAAIGLLSFVAPKTVDSLQPTPWLGIALALLFASVLANAICLWPARYRPPSVEVYNSLETCEAGSLKAPIMLELTEAFLLYNRKLQVISVKKGRWQGLGNVLLIVGVLSLLVNYYSSAHGGQGSTVNPSCMPNGLALTCKKGP
ncbi:MAG TPA: hypothetical protein VKR56_03860 [Candidatus Cybelea sp.]|nr:hypothetical protein [Candidatus Cybelea sp.]